MRVHIAPLALMVAVLLALRAYTAEGTLEPGWSAVEVRAVEYRTGRPVAGARIETTCSISRYVAERPTTNGRATIPIYRIWVGLRVTHPGFTNTAVTLVGTNKVAAFCTNAVIKLGRPGR